MGRVLVRPGQRLDVFYAHRLRRVELDTALAAALAGMQHLRTLEVWAFGPRNEQTGSLDRAAAAECAAIVAALPPTLSTLKV